MCIVATTDCNN